MTAGRIRKYIVGAAMALAAAGANATRLYVLPSMEESEVQASQDEWEASAAWSCHGTLTCRPDCRRGRA